MRPALSILAAAALWTGSLAPGAAQEARLVGLELMVSHASPKPGEIDPNAAELHSRLGKEFRYRSLRVISSQHMNLHVDEVGSMQLPTGSWVRVRPLDLDASGVLLAVDVEGSLQTDLRVPNRHQVVIGAERWEDGKLVITLEPRY